MTSLAPPPDLRHHLPQPPRPRRESSHGGSLTKVTVNLVPRSVDALLDVSARTQDTKTDAINRAVQLYAWCQQMIDMGHELRVLDQNGKEWGIKLL